jgi:hypothetical protein
MHLFFPLPDPANGGQVIDSVQDGLPGLVAELGYWLTRAGQVVPPSASEHPYPHFERTRAAVTATLDPQRLRQAWSAGRRMSPTDAVRYALTPRPAPLEASLVGG